MKEEVQQPTATRGWIRPYVRKQAVRFLAVSLIATLAVACGAALLFTSGYLISRSALQPYNVLMVYVPIVLVRTFGFGRAVIHYVERLISHDMVLRILSAMRVRLYRALEPQAVHIRSRYRTGDILGLLAEDIEQLQNVYLRLALPYTAAVLVYAAGVLILGYMDAAFAVLIALYCGFLLITVPVVTLLASRVIRKKHLKERSLLYQETADSIFGMNDWLLSGRTNHLLERLAQRQAAMADLDRRNRRKEWRAEWIMQCIGGGAVLLMAVWAGSMSTSGQFAPEWIAAYTFVTFPLIEAMVRAGQAVIASPDYRVSTRRLQEVEAAGTAEMEAKTETTTGVNSPAAPADASAEASADASVASPASIPSINIKDGPSDAFIHLDGVGYRYPGSEGWSVRDIHLKVQTGEKIALIGRSGAGKSTLFKLIQGELAPQEGRISIAGVEAQAAREAGLFSVMNQQPYLFDTTIANNIRLGRQNASDEEVMAVAERAGLGELIASLPKGLETPVRETGSRFSGGERQRISLARVLLQNRPIVLLDEPTVGLDPITEQRLLTTLFQNLQGRTLIWITHHLTGMEQMDQIIFLDGGKITMQGSHEQLLQQHERYRQLYALDQPLL